MAMDRSKLELILTRFQARARGYAVREEVRRAREDFEGIVRELDGGLAHLEWRETVICTPHFTDTHAPLSRPRSSACKPPAPGPDVSESRRTAASASSEGRREDHCLHLQKTEAERDDSQGKGQTCLSSSPDRGEGRETGSTGEKDEGLTEVTEDTAIWSGLELDTNCSRPQKGLQKYCLAQDVSQSPKALRLHRDALTMELLWLQQAIDSRKKYLSLKDNLNIC